jgi:hypothetical protein
MVYIAVVGVTTVIFGIAALILISRARNRLTDGSIRRFMDNFSICLAFIVTFSLWQTLRDIYGVGGQVLGPTTYLSYPEYIFIIFAYIAFIITSFRTQKISEEFGFKTEGRKIDELVQQKAFRTKQDKASVSKKRETTRRQKK